MPLKKIKDHAGSITIAGCVRASGGGDCHPAGHHGIGLGEDTGIVVAQGQMIRSIGSDSITIIDGSDVEYNNIGEIEEGKPISIARLVVSIMARHDQFHLKNRTFVPAPDPGKLQKK